MIDIKPANSGGYRAYWSNGVLVGDIYREVDGYYVWWPENATGGCLTEDFLRAMADKLHELNRDWDAEIRKHFEQERASFPSTEITFPDYVPSSSQDCPFDP